MDDVDELGGTCTFSRPRQLHNTPTHSPGCRPKRYSRLAVEAYAEPTAPDVD